MSSCWEANEFFRFYLQRGAIESKKSWDPISRAIYDYFGFLEAHDLNWKDVARGEDKNLLAAYRDYSFEVAGLERTTVRQRLTYICEFYKYAVRRNWIDVLPYTIEIRHVTKNARGFLAHTQAKSGSAETKSVMPRAHRHLIKYLSIDQARMLLGAAVNIHHQTLIRLALSSGLRREELATFPLAYVLAADPGPQGASHVVIRLDPSDGTGMQTKGSKARDIHISRAVLMGLKHYAAHYRGERASLSQGDQPHLFLNQYGLPFANDGQGIEAIVRKLGRKVGLKTYPHMLRHTYATHTLVSLQRRRRKAGIEPIVFLQHQLGHASINTTMVYLHLINEVADDAVLAYDEEIQSWIGG